MLNILRNYYLKDLLKNIKEIKTKINSLKHKKYSGICHFSYKMILLVLEKYL